MNDMAPAIVPKSDQLNGDDLIVGPITITITRVAIKAGEQPVSIFYEGDNGKPYKCCKSMARVMVSAWGADASKYVGRSMTLYRDPTVKWAGMEVGGIRISHMSDIADDMTMALTVTRSNKRPFTVRPLPSGAKSNAAPHSSIATTQTAASNDTVVQGEIAGAATISEAQESAIIDLCELNGVPLDRFLVRAKVTHIAKLPANRFDGAVKWLKEQGK